MSWPDIGVAARMANDMKRARDALLGAHTPLDQSPVLQLRVHPLDLAEIRRKFGDSNLVALNGVPIVADSDAERLPRMVAW